MSNDISKIIVESSAGGIAYINASNVPSYYADAVTLQTDGSTAPLFMTGGKYQKVVGGDLMSYYLDVAKGTQGSNNGAFLGVLLGTYSYAQYWAD